MKIVIESTDIVAEVDGQPYRAWRGTTPGGLPCWVVVACIGIPQRHETELDAEFAPLLGPGWTVPAREIALWGVDN